MKSAGREGVLAAADEQAERFYPLCWKGGYRHEHCPRHTLCTALASLRQLPDLASGRREDRSHATALAVRRSALPRPIRSLPMLPGRGLLCPRLDLRVCKERSDG